MNKQKAKIYNTFLKKKIKLQSSALLDIEACHKALVIQCGVYTGIDRLIVQKSPEAYLFIYEM